MQKKMEEFVEQAINGDKEALEKVLEGIKDNIYNLALRMLWNPADAEDATQEILIKVITNLSKFRGESKFSTWVYSVASNFLINTQKRFMEQQELSFEIFAHGIEEGFEPRMPIHVSENDRELLSEELKVSCTHAMLLCLEREDRLAYILSNMFGINSKAGGEILNITPEAYRKRLSRTREKMRNFMENNCGLLNNNKTCSCKKRVEVAIENHRINPEQLIFVNRPSAVNEYVETCKDEMEAFDQTSAVFQSNPYYLAPETIILKIKKMFDSRNYNILNASLGR